MMLNILDDPGKMSMWDTINLSLDGKFIYYNKDRHNFTIAVFVWEVEI